MTVADWPEGLAAVLRGAADRQAVAVVELPAARRWHTWASATRMYNAATHRLSRICLGYQGWQGPSV